MGRLPSYRDFTPLLGTTRLRAIPYSPSFELSRQKNPQPADSLRRSEKKRPSEGSRRMALSDPKMFARPEYVPLWNSESNVWRSGFAGFLSPLAKSVANPMRGRQRTDEKEYQLSAATRHALIVPTPKLPNCCGLPRWLNDRNLRGRAGSAQNRCEHGPVACRGERGNRIRSGGSGNSQSSCSLLACWSRAGQGNRGTRSPRIRGQVPRLQDTAACFRNYQILNLQGQPRERH